MKLELICKTNTSSKGKSPSLFKSDTGEFYIQGFMVDSKIAIDANCPAGETIVKIDKGLLEEILKHIG